jgi:hypothetical protein
MERNIPCTFFVLTSRRPGLPVKRRKEESTTKLLISILIAASIALGGLVAAEPDSRRALEELSAKVVSTGTTMVDGLKSCILPRFKGRLALKQAAGRRRPARFLERPTARSASTARWSCRVKAVPRWVLKLKRMFLSALGPRVRSAKTYKPASRKRLTWVWKSFWESDSSLIGQDLHP